MQLNTNELRILILFALASAGTGISPEALCSAVSRDEIGYLNVREAFEKLREEGLLNVTEDEGSFYTSITPAGKLIASELQGTLSITLRKETAAEVAREMTRMRKELSVTAAYEETAENGGGFNIRLGLSDRGEQLFSMTVFSPTALQAEIIARNFRDNPGRFYTGVITMLTAKSE